MSPVRRHLIATTEHVMKTKWKLSGVIHKIVLVKLANGAKESGHHVLQLVVMEQNKGKRKKKHFAIQTKFKTSRLLCKCRRKQLGKSRR